MPSDTCSSSAHGPLQRGPIADVSDYRPTVVSDPRPIFHRYIHNDEAMLASYLGFGNNLCNLRTLAVSGPVLKYVPAAFALLGIPEVGCNNPADKPRAEVACTWALAILFNEKTRSVLPDTLQKIQDKYKISWCAVRAPKAQNELLGDPKKRGQVLAAVLLAMYRDMLAAQQMPPEQFESIFVPAIVALEEQNPWDSPVYMLPMIPGDKITWPDWGPVKGHCGCEELCEPLEEHDVEVYHRCLSLIRYTIYQLEPTYFYKHLGKCLKNQLDSQVALVAVARVKEEQLLEVAEARVRSTQQYGKCKGKAKAEEQAQENIFSPLNDLTHNLTKEMRPIVAPDVLSEFESNVQKVYDLAIEQFPDSDWSKEEKRLMSESFMHMMSNGAGGASGPPHWTDRERKVHANLHQPFAFPPGADVKFEVHQANEDLGDLIQYMTKMKLAGEQMAKATPEKQKADLRLQDAAFKLAKANSRQEVEKTRLQEYKAWLDHLCELD
ncbi:hypothetical protein ACHAQH_008113 [Verticillium albo-atrum]